MDYKQHLFDKDCSKDPSSLECINCGKKGVKLYKHFSNNDIYTCENCQLGFLKNIAVDKTKLTELYDFNNYRKNEARYRNNLSQIARRVVTYVKSGNILDIGCGFGLLSSILLNSGKFKLEVVEPVLDPQYLKSVKIVRHKQELDDFLKINNKKYDLIIFMDVIEHLLNPPAVLDQLRFILTENGKIVIQTPNYRSLMQKLCRNWSWWMIEDHKYFFTPKSLNLMLSKTHFKVVHSTTYESYYDFKKNLDGNFTHIQPPNIRKLFKLVFHLFFTSFYLCFRQVLWHFGYGGLIFMIASSQKYEK